eukprot:4936126-Amphidinium_carterae.1
MPGKPIIQFEEEEMQRAALTRSLDGVPHSQLIVAVFKCQTGPAISLRPQAHAVRPTSTANMTAYAPRTFKEAEGGIRSLVGAAIAASVLLDHASVTLLRDRSCPNWVLCLPLSVE